MQDRDVDMGGARCIYEHFNQPRFAASDVCISSSARMHLFISKRLNGPAVKLLFCSHELLMKV